MVCSLFNIIKLTRIFFTILVSLHATEPFEQESVKSNRNFGGIGLGLAISKQIVMRHGGDIYINSSPGQGSSFTISLPVTKDAMAKISSQDSKYLNDHNMHLRQSFQSTISSSQRSKSSKKENTLVLSG